MISILCCETLNDHASLSLQITNLQHFLVDKIAKEVGDFAHWEGFKVKASRSGEA